jgi:hypothetical protein
LRLSLPLGIMSPRKSIPEIRFSPRRIQEWRSTTAMNHLESPKAGMEVQLA